jgi:hypothetical protein
MSMTNVKMTSIDDECPRDLKGLQLDIRIEILPGLALRFSREMIYKTNKHNDIGNGIESDRPRTLSVVHVGTNLPRTIAQLEPT